MITITKSRPSKDCYYVCQDVHEPQKDSGAFKRRPRRQRLSAEITLSILRPLPLVSLLADGETRRKIEAAHRAAVRSFFRYMETHLNIR